MSDTPHMLTFNNRHCGDLGRETPGGEGGNGGNGGIAWALAPTWKVLGGRHRSPVLAVWLKTGDMWAHLLWMQRLRRGGDDGRLREWQPILWDTPRPSCSAAIHSCSARSLVGAGRAAAQVCAVSRSSAWVWVAKPVLGGLGVHSYWDLSPSSCPTVLWAPTRPDASSRH